MKTGADNRKKTIAAGVLGALALCLVVWFVVTQFSGTSTPPPEAAPVVSEAKPEAGTPVSGSAIASSTAARTGGAVGLGAIPGVAATKITSTSASLDPTLDESAMLRTESLVYTGTGRNIFSLTYEAPVAPMPTAPSARPHPTAPVASQAPLPPPTCPPSCPPISLKFFGTVARVGSAPQAFLLSGDDVYLASQGDIVARKYKIVSISATSIQVEDLSNTNTQTLPLQQ
jgi:hypothetical protein